MCIVTGCLSRTNIYGLDLVILRANSLDSTAELIIDLTETAPSDENTIGPALQASAFESRAWFDNCALWDVYDLSPPVNRREWDSTVS